MLVAGNQVLGNTATEKSHPSVSVTAFYASFVHCFDTVSLIFFFFLLKWIEQLVLWESLMEQWPRIWSWFVLLLNSIKGKLPVIQNACHRGTLLGGLHIFSGLIKGLNVFFDTDPHKNDLVPDWWGYSSEQIIQNPCHHEAYHLVGETEHIRSTLDGKTSHRQNNSEGERQIDLIQRGLRGLTEKMPWEQKEVTDVVGFEFFIYFEGTETEYADS